MDWTARAREIQQKLCCSEVWCDGLQGGSGCTSIIAALAAEAYQAGRLEGESGIPAAYDAAHAAGVAEALKRLLSEIEGWLDAVERVDEPAYSGYGLQHICEQMRAALRARL